MSEQINRRVPGKRVFTPPERPRLRLVATQEPNRPDAKNEFSPEVKEMLREMNRRHVATRNSDAPAAA